MGLCISTIQFEESVPSFQAISEQYKRQTGLSIQLIATIHLVTGEFAPLLDSPAALLPLLQADAAAVAEIDAMYGMTSSTLQWEKERAEKQPLNHIIRTQLVVSYSGELYPVEVLITDHTIEVWQYSGQYYTSVSLIKTLVDLGGKYIGHNEQPVVMPKKWHKLKRWEDYKWYNRPRK